MADNASAHETQSNAALEKDVDISRGAKEDTARPLAMTIGDDSVFYDKEEKILQQTHDSTWAPSSGEPVWPINKKSSLQILNSEVQSSAHAIGLMEASSGYDKAAMQEIESKMENQINHASSTDTDIHAETATNMRITHTEELSTPPAVPLRVFTPALAAQMKEQADTSLDDSCNFLPNEAGDGVAGLPEVSSESLEEVEQEDGLDFTCESNSEPFNHLKHTKYGTVSYRRIRRGQTRKRIEMFESMMQL